MHEKFPALPHIIERRERVFLVLAGLFLGTLTMLNILGISRFIKLYEIVFYKDQPDQWSLVFAVAIGVLPYPLTFLCTDLISEFYGRSRANWVVFVGLILNLWVVAILLLGGMLPGWEQYNEQGQMIRDAAGRLPVFYEIRKMTLAAVGASMVAYLAAQYVDVYLYHFWMKLTKGKHLWLRNNGSTMISQLVDTVAVILITYFTFNVFDPDSGAGLPINENQSVVFQLVVSFILAGYAFKAIAALLDTIPMYILSSILKYYLQMDPASVYADPDES
ncbi:MAG TPA: transporter [Phycisphaerales bacterium]|nr:transporter [Phycisphaerales bacterium]HCD31104.1 transporter [Phycisphaerales bacterium]|tara:strand:- start:2495 stop:3322 length:828 start_codon:yes stop_codon:yes gene_type:complete